MSGGAFDYIQYRFSDIIARIEEEIADATKERPPLISESAVSIWRVYDGGGKVSVHHNYKTLESAKKEYANKKFYRILEESEKEIKVQDKVTNEVYEIREYVYTDYADGGYYPDYKPETLEEFRKGIEAIKRAYVYAQRIDWLLSGDDGEETFHERLKEDLKANKILEME